MEGSGIVLNLDHAIPMTLIDSIQGAGPLKGNFQPITQALNMGLKNKVDIAYANAYKTDNKKVMRAIEKVADEIGLPMGKVTDKFWDLGQNY